MDNIEITVFDEIKDYKEKIYFFNFRQWIFAILIIIAVVPTYLILKEKIGEVLLSELDIKQKRIEVRKLNKKGVPKKYIDLFIKLLEYMAEV